MVYLDQQRVTYEATPNRKIEDNPFICLHARITDMTLVTSIHCPSRDCRDMT